VPVPRRSGRAPPRASALLTCSPKPLVSLGYVRPSWSALRSPVLVRFRRPGRGERGWWCSRQGPRSKGAAPTIGGWLAAALLVAPLRAAEPASTEAPIQAAPAPSPSEPEPAPMLRGARLRCIASRAASWFLSSDDALPLFSVGASICSRIVMRLWPPGRIGSSSAAERPDADDVVGARSTVGASPVIESTIGSDAPGTIHLVGGALRVVHILPLGARLALWPHVGVAYGSSRDARFIEERHRTDLVADLRLAWTPNGCWGPDLGSLALVAGRRRSDDLDGAHRRRVREGGRHRRRDIDGRGTEPQPPSCGLGRPDRATRRGAWTRGSLGA